MIEKYAVKETNKEDFATKELIEPDTPKAKKDRELQDQLIQLMKLKDRYLDRYVAKRRKIVFRLYKCQDSGGTE